MGNTCSWGRHELLLKPAVDVDADELEVVAGVGPPDAAGVAAPAGADRQHRHPLAVGEVGPAVRPHRGDGGADLVAEDPGELGAAGGVGHLAGEQVVVRAAQSHRLGPDEHLAGAGGAGLGPVEHRHLADALSDGGAHQPHTSAAVSTTSASLAFWSS